MACSRRRLRTKSDRQELGNDRDKSRGPSVDLHLGHGQIVDFITSAAQTRTYNTDGIMCCNAARAEPFRQCNHVFRLKGVLKLSQCTERKNRPHTSSSDMAWG